MAESKENILTAGLSGTIGKMLTFRQRRGKTVVSKFLRPTKVPATEKLISIRSRFAVCIAYAKAAVKNPALKALYQAAIKGGQTAFNVATSDALNPPRVVAILTDGYAGFSGNEIIVQATDDFKVAEVTASIHNPSGELIESGNTVMIADTADWLYTSTRENPEPIGSKITAVAMDLPGNSGSLSVVLI